MSVASVTHAPNTLGRWFHGTPLALWLAATLDHMKSWSALYLTEASQGIDTCQAGGAMRAPISLGP